MPVVEYFSSHSSLHSIARIHKRIHEYIYKYEYYIRNGSQLHVWQKVVDDRIWICRAFIAGLCVCLCCCAKLVFVPLIFNKLFSAECPKTAATTTTTHGAYFMKKKTTAKLLSFLILMDISHFRAISLPFSVWSHGIWMRRNLNNTILG